MLSRGQSTAAVEAALAVIREREPAVRAWVLVDADGARTQAAQLDRAAAFERPGPLHGMTAAVKDLVDVAGLPTRCGSSTRDDAAPAANDADVVARIRVAGAAILGKTVTTEYAYFDPGPTRNPHDTARTPGGSSSGSAAAVAAGMADLAVATQTAASTVRPASYCGIAALVTSYGRWPTAGIQELSGALDTVGLMTRTVEQLVTVTAALYGVTVADLTRAPRIAVFDGSAFGGVEDGMRAALTLAVARARAAGARVSPLPCIDGLGDLSDVHSTLLAAGAHRALGHLLSAGDEPGHLLRALLTRGSAITATQEQDAARHAMTVRGALGAALDETGADVVLAPAATGPAPVGTATGNPDQSRCWHALGLPAVVVPGLTDVETGMPLGVQLLARPGADEAALTAAHWLARHLTADNVADRA
ncbi:amidase [Mycobacterium sp. NAZ190054]|uniref:amidase family protein n=1 Tax=Mycobacterium sp. NAZ190054 TaxID=1747766 RepID=UPI000792DCFF|nr:amidase [Mycobacterium sp. NAZ190054]KWX68486.1 hypothetical protein ASJ79_17575 [Mycobacterium sp. NAZ190054]